MTFTCKLYPVFLFLALLIGTSYALGNNKELLDRIEALEQSVEQQNNLPKIEPFLGKNSWIDKLHISGNADFYYFNGGKNSHSPDSRLAVDNARLFFDFFVNDNVSLFMEWEILTEFTEENHFTQLYLQLNKLFEIEPLNLRIGRGLIPYGEEYTRFHNDRFKNPLITFSAPAPWWWDEGVFLFGSGLNRRLNYNLAILDGDFGFNRNTSEQVQVAGKVSYKPSKGVKFSLSGLSTGKIGSTNRRGISAMFYAGNFIAPFGARTVVDNYSNGKVTQDDPANAFRARSWEIDSIFSSDDWGRLWFAFGQIYISSDGSSLYDRELQYWIAEGILNLEAISQRLYKCYLAMRCSGIGTYDSNEGYSLKVFNDGDDLGYNTDNVKVVSIGGGIKLKENVNFKLEYAWYDFTLVNGVPRELKDRAKDRNLLIAGFSVKF